jgi:hypothetical protein
VAGTDVTAIIPTTLAAVRAAPSAIAVPVQGQSARAAQRQVGDEQRCSAEGGPGDQNTWAEDCDQEVKHVHRDATQRHRESQQGDERDKDGGYRGRPTSQAPRGRFSFPAAER